MQLHPLEVEGFNGTADMATLISPQTTPPPEAMRKMSNSSQIDSNLQATLVFGPQQSQSLFVEQSSSTSPPVGGNSHHLTHLHEMIYKSPFPHSISSPPYETSNNIQPMLFQHQQQTALMMPPYDPLANLSTTQFFQQPNHRSQSLTLLPTSSATYGYITNGQESGQMSGHAGHQHQFTSHTPPPIFPANTPPVDLKSLLLGNSYVAPNQHITHLTPSANNSPTINNSLGMNFAYAGLTDRSSPRSFPKPPIPPSSPSIKEKRRQQAQMKTYKEPSSSPNGHQTG